MTQDIDLLDQIIQWCIIIAAISTTAFPVLYAFAPWKSTRLGQMLMLQAVAFALAIDLTLLFKFWLPSNIILVYALQAGVFLFIAGATVSLTIFMVRMNYRVRKEAHAE